MRREKISKTAEETHAYALQTKEAMEDNSTPELEKVHAELSKKLNVDPDEYFTHPDVLKQYEKTLVVGKLIEQLHEEEILSDAYTMDDFKKDLRKKADIRN